MSLQDFHREQPHIVSFFLSQLRYSRLSHAYLFYGAEEVGQSSLALQLAKAIQCQQSLDSYDSCDTCISCQKIEARNHPDVQSITPEETSLKIKQVRRLQQEMYYQPYEGDHKVYIIEKSHRMTLAAQNSLLKTLESPPGYAILILTTENKDALLSTIQSRCQRILFRGSTNTRYQPTEEEESLHQEIREHFPILMTGGYTEIFQAIEVIDKRYNKKMEEVFYIFLSLFRALLLIKMDSGEEMEEIGKIEEIEEMKEREYQEEIEDLAQEYSSQEIQRMVKVVETSCREVRRNVSKRLALEVMWLKIRGRGGLEDEESGLGYL